MPDPAQVIPFNLEEHPKPAPRFSCLSSFEPSHGTKEAHFDCLHEQPHSSGHCLKLVTISNSRSLASSSALSLHTEGHSCTVWNNHLKTQTYLNSFTTISVRSPGFFFLAEYNCLRLDGAEDSYRCCFTLSCKPFQCWLITSKWSRRNHIIHTKQKTHASPPACALFSYFSSKNTKHCICTSFLILAYYAFQSFIPL